MQPPSQHLSPLPHCASASHLSTHLSETQNCPLGQPAAGQPVGLLPALPPLPLEVLPLLPPLPPPLVPPVMIGVLPPVPDAVLPLLPPAGKPPKPPLPAIGLSSSSSPHADTNAA